MIPFPYTPGQFQVKMWDVAGLNLLPAEWTKEVSVVADRHAEVCVLDGRSSTSREPENVAPMKVCVVGGETILAELPWLYHAYAEAFRELAQQLIGRELSVGTATQSNVNINLLQGEGQRYERHVDSNPVTGLLFASTLDDSDGGALVFDHGYGVDVIHPRAGLLLMFDATATVHYVAPLKRSCIRLTIPMNYFLAGTKQERPPDLDTYLYGKG